jgi:hypothetical protein
MVTVSEFNKRKTSCLLALLNLLDLILADDQMAAQASVV